jgi:predicted nucleic acid-binding protein
MPVLDATFLIDLERDPGRLQDLVRTLVADEDLVVPAQAAIEFACGTSDPAETLRKLREGFSFLPLDGEIALEAARLAKEASRDGVFPGWPDIQIAATARHLGMAILSRNARHFHALGIEVVGY